MTQILLSDANHDDEVLRFWALQANHMQTAYEALWRYLECPVSSSSTEEQSKLGQS